MKMNKPYFESLSKEDLIQHLWVLTVLYNTVSKELANSEKLLLEEIASNLALKRKLVSP